MSCQEKLGWTLPQGMVGTRQPQGLGVGAPVDVGTGWAHLGMESGQDTHCPIVADTFLPCR